MLSRSCLCCSFISRIFYHQVVAPGAGSEEDEEEPSKLHHLTFSLRGKKGVAFTLREGDKEGSWIENLPKVLALHPYWNYSWSTRRLDEKLQPPSIEFLPMLWDYNRTEIAYELEFIKAQKSRIILGFNEPDNSSQSNMQVREALEAWPQLESINLPLVSPSCVDAEGPWMKAFMLAIDRRGLRVDIVGLHYYGGASPIAFQKKLERVYSKYGRPILVTEFAVADWKANTPQENRYSKSAVLHYMEEVLPWLEARPWILGYAWFSFHEDNPAGTSSALYHGDGTMTELGGYYSGFKPNKSLRVV